MRAEVASSASRLLGATLLAEERIGLGETRPAVALDPGGRPSPRDAPCKPWTATHVGPSEGNTHRAGSSMALIPEGEEICSEADGGPGSAAEGVNLNPGTLEEALHTIQLLHERQLNAKPENKSKMAQQLLVWRRRALAYEEALVKMSRASQEQMLLLSGQLMVLNARLVRKQKDIGRMLAQRDAAIQRQHRALHLMQARLQEAGLDMAHGDLDSPTGETNLDSLNDSDSAVIMEDGPGSDHEHSVFPRFRGTVTVVRSVSDAVEAPSAKWRQLQYSSQPQRGNCFLRRPEVLETVYSVEEDGEAEDNHQEAEPQSRRTSHSYKADSNSSIDDTPSADDSSCSGRHWAAGGGGGGGGGTQYSSLEILTDPGDCGTSPAPATPGGGGPNHVTTYNRVMSNHRSVTKPKDVKYKRINKAKSKSLEELRGRLRNWVDKGITTNKFISLDQSYA